MKKLLLGLAVLAVFMVSVPLTTDAQTCHPRRQRARVSRSYAVRSYNYQRPGFWQRHRNLKNIALATGGGALLGGLIGGSRKGIGIGALVGAGSGALYTYVLKPKKRVYRNYR